MKTIHVILFQIFLLFPVYLFSQILSQERANEFIQTLIEKSDSLENYIFSEELSMSNRLKISYEGVKHKYLISYDIDPIIKSEIKNHQPKYELQIDHLFNEFSKLRFRIPNKNYHKDYYFKGNYLVSPIYLYSSNWDRIESEHFLFVVSNPVLFNSYCINRLEEFFNRISTVLNYSDEQKTNLKIVKIYYFICRDEDEIEKITGFQTRGIYNLGYDYIITTFNCHYHELLHLLINYKIQKLPLYTHPFFQEGFAVAFGGRGGKEPKVILDLGLFLERSNMLEYSALLSKDGFYQYDVSLSYPLSGLYSYFLIKKFGIEPYLNLYLKYSGNADEINDKIINEYDLPPKNAWNKFISEYSKNKLIEVGNYPSYMDTIYQNNFVQIAEDSTHYFFRLKDTLLISIENPLNEYQSKKFAEILPDRQYVGEKYLIMSNSDEVKLYNLYTNNLIANYVSSFSIAMKSVPKNNEYFMFSIRKELFDEPLDRLYFDRQ